MPTEHKLTLISGGRELKRVVKTDRFNMENVFYGASEIAGFRVGRHRDILGTRGGHRNDVLSVSVSNEDFETLTEVYRKTKSHTAFHLVRAVDLGLHQIIARFMKPSTREAYFEAKKLEYREIYPHGFLEQCYRRAYERGFPGVIYRSNFGELINPPLDNSPYLIYDPRYVSLDRAHVKSVRPKSLQRCLANAIENIISTPED